MRSTLTELQRRRIIFNVFRDLLRDTATWIAADNTTSKADYSVPATMRVEVAELGESIQVRITMGEEENAIPAELP